MIPLTTLANGNKKARFSLGATFGGSTARCCEVRQYIRWDQRFHTRAGGPPHSGFPSSATYDNWYEDRDTADKRYGHRGGPHADPRPSCGDEYLDSAGARDQANGTRYCGRDGPEGFSTDVGQWQFQLRVIDTCHGGSEKASSPIITVRWG